MTAIEEADQLQEQLIERLLAVHQDMENRLTRLGYFENKTAPMKKRGRPAKPSETFAQPDTIGSAVPSAL